MIVPEKRHFLQSHEWADFQKALGKTVFERSGDGWSYMAILEKGDGKVGRLFKRLYTPYGPSYRDKAALKEALADLESLAGEQKADYVRVEPLALNPSNAVTSFDGYQKMRRSFQPHLTLMIDLDRTFDDVKKDMHRTSRYRWNRVDRDGITFSISYQPQDIAPFVKMMDATSARTKATFWTDTYYRPLIETLGPKQVAGIAYAKHDGEELVGVLFIDDFEAKTRYYLYTGSFDKARQFGANAPLVVFLFKDAQERGITCFDFFGVSPEEDKNHSWAGLSAFKRSFGGEERAFVGTWEKPIKAVRYKVMHNARKLIS